MTEILYLNYDKLSPAELGIASQDLWYDKLLL